MKDWMLIIAGLGSIAIVVITITYGLYDHFILNPACLENGYVSSKMTWKFDRYCIKRMDQSDIVISYDKVLKGLHP